MLARRTQRTPQAQAYQAWYKTARWQSLRAYHLTVEPLCRMCLGHGRTTPATIVHHVEPHKGDPSKFWNGPFASLCAPCHDSKAQSIERRGYSNEIGLDGWPTDPAHPANR